MPLSDYSWSEFFPHGLTKEERENPYQVIGDLFSYSHLPELREQLWELINTTVTGNYCKMSRRERSNLMFFYKKLEKLIEAVHLIHKRQDENYKQQIDDIKSCVSK